MSQCKHGAFPHPLPPGMRKLRCGGCRDYIPLGPARDTAETAVEVRAYALAHGANDFSPDEREGWRRHESGRDVIGDSGDPVADEYHQRHGMHGWVARRWAGWLAREMGEDR